MIAFTICAKNYLAKALVLRESFLAYHPLDSFLIVIADAIGSQTECKLISEALDGVNVIFFQEIRNKIDFPRLEELLVKYDVTELCTAIKPFVFQYLFKSGYDEIVYLDPDIMVYSQFVGLKWMWDKKNIILTPHSLSPKPKADDDITFLAAGAYNLGFLALRKSESADSLLSWWGERLLDHCYKEPRPFFTDQKWFDLVPSMFDDVGIMKHPGYNVARWNLHERTFAVEDGKWYVNGEYPLVFYHFSQDKKNQNQSAPFGLFREYNEKLLEKKNNELAQLAYYYDTVPGTDIAIDSWRKRQAAGHGTTADYQILRPDNRFLEAYTGKVQDRAFGLNIVGWLRHHNSVGQVARDFIRGLLSAGVPFAWTPLDEKQPGVSLTGLGQLEYYRSNDSIFDTTVYFVNADMLPSVSRAYPHLRGRKNIGIFWWELRNHFPFTEAFDYVDHALTFSQFVNDIMCTYATKNVGVRKLTYPLRQMEVSTTAISKIRANMGLSPEDFLFGYAFDYNSCEERKNPYGLLDAFSNAFTPEDKVWLFLKLSNATGPQAEKLWDAAKRSVMRDRIRICWQTLDEFEYDSLLGACDCYVSLHRSEGLGLGMMEAMAMGKPVIATNYGGNLEYMTEKNSFLVNTRPTTVQEPFKNYYPAGAMWAQPDQYHAIELMRQVYRNREEAAERVQQARRDMLKFQNPSNRRQEILSFMNSLDISSYSS